MLRRNETVGEIAKNSWKMLYSKTLLFFTIKNMFMIMLLQIVDLYIA